MPFPIYYPPAKIVTPAPASLVLRQEMLEPIEERCSQCRPMILKKDGTVEDMDKRRFEMILKHWQNLYSQRGTSM